MPYVVVCQNIVDRDIKVLGPYRTNKAAQRVADKLYDDPKTTRAHAYTVHELTKP